MDSKSEVDCGAMPSRYMRTASEMKAMQDEADTFTKEMMDKAVRQMGEAHAQHMEKMIAETMVSGTAAVKYGDVSPLQFPSGDPAGDPYPHTTGGHTGISRGPSGHTHELPDAPPDTGIGSVPRVTLGEEVELLINHAVAEAVAHLVSELDGMTQRCQELEIDLEIEKNKFNDNNWDDFEPKLRGNFEN